MDDQQLRLTAAEITRAFSDPAIAAEYPPTLDVGQAARLLHVPTNTIYDWSSRGLLRGTCRKLGKRLVFWRDRLVAKAFNHGIQE